METDSSNLNQKNIISSIRETLEASSIHGIPNMTRNSYYWIKLMWLFFFLVSLGSCCWFIADVMAEYQENKVNSKIVVVNENKLIFPVVSICNSNFFKGKMSINRKEINIFSINESIIECRFNQIECNVGQDFEYFYDVNFGNCYRFNSGKNLFGESVEKKYTIQSGILNGLDLEVFVGESKENGIANKENGLAFFINDGTFDSTSSREGVKISPGFSTNVILKKHKISRKSSPYSDCMSDLTSKDSYGSECYKRLFSYNRTYTYSDCMFMCLQKYFI
jgi:hypothetical protein